MEIYTYKNMFLGRALVRTNRTICLSRSGINFGRYNFAKITPGVRLCSDSTGKNSDTHLYDKIDNMIGGSSIILLGGAMSYFCPPVTLVVGTSICVIGEGIRILGLFLILFTLFLMWLVEMKCLPRPYY